MCARKVIAFITLRGSRTMNRQDCEYFGLSHYKEKRGEYANTFNAEAKITTFAKARKHRIHAAKLRLEGLQPLIWRLATNLYEPGQQLRQLPLRESHPTNQPPTLVQRRGPDC
ncbi:hypothetical protein ALP98_100765 [Pseudomonas viridiflava]|uniref:Uncharacterized protein n=2 Tax=Pseudomonas syringae group TaxID=136849 RepID=A0A3M4PPZ6_PSEVI|nr:hypothetical protein ALQ30_100583 [Pseudomonas syringae pv. persicae]RMQ06343.1 hypothetical protein ALQ09_100506 [Pseudomonas viridiflava]RMQ80271.1 hypothetical protein ALP98_100765 [Pseudomonas viridiflava]